MNFQILLYLENIANNLKIIDIWSMRRFFALIKMTHSYFALPELLTIEYLIKM